MLIKVLAVFGLLVGCGGPAVEDGTDPALEVQEESSFPPPGHTTNGRCVVTRANSTAPTYENGKCIALDQCILPTVSAACVNGRAGALVSTKICLNGAAGAYDAVVCTF
jgi:hypothetical protein